MTREEALAYTDTATTFLFVHILQVGFVGTKWATLVHDTLEFSEGIASPRLDEIVDRFQELYWLLCAERGIRPHDLDAVRWKAYMDEYNSV